MLKDKPGMQPGKPRLRNPVAQVTQPCLPTGFPILPAWAEVWVLQPQLTGMSADCMQSVGLVQSSRQKTQTPQMQEQW